MKDLNNIAIYARVAETRSFSAAGEQLDLSASAVSKAVSRLEEELGIRLLHRTTRSVTPTIEGAEFLERCRSILADINEAESSVSGVMGKPQGKLRIVLPVALGHRIIVPALWKLAHEHPQLMFDCELTDRVPDLLYEGLDCAVLIGPVADQRLVARKLCHLRFFPCASPAYLAEHGTPETPDDLDAHRCLAFVLPQSGKYREWQFQRDGIVFTKSVAGPVNVNHGLSMLEAAIAGEGIAMLSSFMLDEALQTGKLKLLLREYATQGPPVWLVYPERRNLATKVRLFADFVASLFPAVPPWDAPVIQGRY